MTRKGLTPEEKRLKELAKKQGKDETTARVDKLLEKENDRYKQKFNKMQERKQDVISTSAKTGAEKIKGKSKQKEKPEDSNDNKD